MGFGFRKSVFGFHRDDVVRYIETMQQNALAEKQALEAQIASLESEGASLREERAALSAEREALLREIGEYTAKQAEIEKLSEGIGRLYLVAQSNAETVSRNAQENAAASDAAVAENLDAIAQAQDVLTELKQQLDALSARFLTDVDGLQRRLTDAKTQVSVRRAESEQASESVLSLIRKVADEA